MSDMKKASNSICKVEPSPQQMKLMFYLFLPFMHVSPLGTLLSGILFYRNTVTKALRIIFHPCFLNKHFSTLLCRKCIEILLWRVCVCVCFSVITSQLISSTGWSVLSWSANTFTDWGLHFPAKAVKIANGRTPRVQDKGDWTGSAKAKESGLCSKTF